MDGSELWPLEKCRFLAFDVLVMNRSDDNISKASGGRLACCSRDSGERPMSNQEGRWTTVNWAEEDRWDPASYLEGVKVFMMDMLDAMGDETKILVDMLSGKKLETCKGRSHYLIHRCLVE